MAFAGHDDVIQHAQAEDLGGFGQLLVRAQVSLAWLHIAGGMVVGEDHRGGAVGDDVGEDLARVHRAAIKQSDCHDAFGDGYTSVPMASARAGG